MAGRKNNKSGAKRGAKADSRSGPRTKVNAMSKEDTSEKKNLKWSDPLITPCDLSDGQEGSLGSYTCSNI